MNKFRGELHVNEPLSKYTTWRVGGPAKQLYKPADLKDLSEFLAQRPKQEPILWMGLGSNLLVRDGGFPGTVILTQACLRKIETLEHQLVRAESGAACASLARFSAREGMSGVEFMAGIPGTVGGALTMNAGCFQGETWQWVEAVEIMDANGEIRLMKPEDFAVSYRQVDAKDKIRRWFIAGHFRLQPGDKEESLAKIREMLDKRAASQPTGQPSCGSVFRNPPGDHAGRLIEACGLKGFIHGGAQVSTKHANFIVNTGNACSRDIEEIIEIVRDKVSKEHGVLLKHEVHIIGDPKTIEVE
jgi:UDP-N-acetylmuramate dehydrogenase